MEKANCFDCGQSIELCVCVDNVGCGCCDKMIEGDCVLEGDCICPKDK